MENSVYSFDDFLSRNNPEVKDKESVQKKNSEITTEKVVEKDFEKSEVDEELSIIQNHQTPISQPTHTRIQEPIKESVELDSDIIEDSNEILYEVSNNEEEDNSYPIYKDKSEIFSCDIRIEGASQEDAKARLLLECDNWNIFFDGEIKNGKVTIPIKKMNILNEGVRGRIKLEIIAEDTVFTPWEDDFKIKMSKKVTVSMNDSKSNNSFKSNPKNNNNIGVKVNVKR
jgi:hypothetical protein